MIDQNRALESFLRYIAIDSETHHEKPMTELLVRELEALGLTEGCTCREEDLYA